MERTTQLVSLRSSHTGLFLCAENGGGGSLCANRSDARAWESFTLVELGDGKVAVRSRGGWFMCAEGGGGREVTISRREVSAWETFGLTRHADGRLSFQAHNGQWVCVEAGGGVVANRSACDEWEKFAPAEIAETTPTPVATSGPRCRFCKKLAAVGATDCVGCGASL